MKAFNILLFYIINFGFLCIMQAIVKICNYHTAPLYQLTTQNGSQLHTILKAMFSSWLLDNGGDRVW